MAEITLKVKTEDILKAGFKATDDIMFPYEYELVSKEKAAEYGLAKNEVPTLLFGTSGINHGFCIYTGEHFIWINAAEIQEAIAFSEKIIAIEPV